MSNYHDDSAILVFGAHPDDIEFGCGGVIAKDTMRGRAAHFVLCSRGEAASSGNPEQRESEAREAARILGASSVEFQDFGGDAHFEANFANTLRIARSIRQHRPGIVLAPTFMENQHPDHSRLGKMVRDAARLARYGGLLELGDLEPVSIKQLLFYAVTPDAVLSDRQPLLVDVSAPEVMQAWTSAMSAHASQVGSRGYIDLQLNRSKLWGARAGVEYAIDLYPNDPLLFDSISDAGRGVRNF